jgi:hypothetical protein
VSIREATTVLRRWKVRRGVATYTSTYVSLRQHTSVYVTIRQRIRTCSSTAEKVVYYESRKREKNAAASRPRPFIFLTIIVVSSESMSENYFYSSHYSRLEETCRPEVFSFPHFSISPRSFCTRNVTCGTNPLFTVQVQREMEKVEKRKLWGDTFPAIRWTTNLF